MNSRSQGAPFTVKKYAFEFWKPYPGRSTARSSGWYTNETVRDSYAARYIEDGFNVAYLTEVLITRRYVTRTVEKTPKTDFEKAGPGSSWNVTGRTFSTHIVYVQKISDTMAYRRMPGTEVGELVSVEELAFSDKDVWTPLALTPNV